MKTNQSSNNVTFITSVARLEARLDDCIGSDDYLAVIEALVATEKKAAVRVLAELLDMSGPVAEAAIAGLVTLARHAGIDVAPRMKRCADSDDYEMGRHAHRVLAELGDAESAQWLRYDDEDRIEAYLDEKGFTEEREDERAAIKLAIGVVNDVTAPYVVTCVATFEAALEKCGGSEDYVKVIREIVEARPRGSVRVLAGLLDSTGPIAEESIRGLVTLAREGGAEADRDVVSAMKECADSEDYDMIRHAHRVLGELGHRESKAWLREDDGERAEAFLDRVGLTDPVERVFDELQGEGAGGGGGVANDAGEDEGVA